MRLWKYPDWCRKVVAQKVTAHYVTKNLISFPANESVRLLPVHIVHKSENKELPKAITHTSAFMCPVARCRTLDQVNSKGHKTTILQTELTRYRRAATIVGCTFIGRINDPIRIYGKCERNEWNTKAATQRPLALICLLACVRQRKFDVRGAYILLGAVGKWHWN